MPLGHRILLYLGWLALAGVSVLLAMMGVLSWPNPEWVDLVGTGSTLFCIGSLLILLRVWVYYRCDWRFGWTEFADLFPDRPDQETPAIPASVRFADWRGRRSGEKSKPPFPTLERWADAVKDAILDCHWPFDRDTDAHPAAPLAPLDRNVFIAQMQGKVAETVERIATTLAYAESADDLEDCEPQVRTCLNSLGWHAVNLALEQRLPPEGATAPAESVAGRPPVPPHSWAGKYRRMVVAGE